MSDLSSHEAPATLAHHVRAEADRPEPPEGDAASHAGRGSHADPALRGAHPALRTATAKDVLTVIGGAGAVCYMFGFVIVSIFLQAQGIYDLALFSWRYIGAGVCFFVFSAVAVLPPYDAWDRLTRGQERIPWRRAAWVVPLCLAGSVLASLFLLGVLAMRLFSDPDTYYLVGWAWWTATTAHPVAFYVGWQLLLFLAGVLLVPAMSGMPRDAWRYRRAVFAGSVVLLTLVAMKNYVTAIFPLVNPAYGGGQSMQVQLLIENKPTGLAPRLNLPVESGGSASDEVTLTGVLWLVDQSEKSVYVSWNDGAGVPHTLQLDKAVIRAAIKPVEPPPVEKPPVKKEAGPADKSQAPTGS